MALPKAVQKQVDESNKLHADEYAGEPIVTAQEVVGEPTTPTLTTVEDAPPLPPAGETPPVSEVPQGTPEAQKPVDWEHKYSVIR
jgi:hypothetical protein